jgi:glutathione peroxidase-family protein
MFDWLKAQKGGLFGNDIKWNFSKFLVDKEGNVVGRWGGSAGWCWSSDSALQLIRM